MLRRDIIMAEIKKLTEVLEKILALKNANRPVEAENLLNAAVAENFDLNVEDLSGITTQDFETILKNKSYSADMLQMLGHFLFESVYPFEDVPETEIMLHKVLLIFRLLEEDHHIQSFVNLSKREMIDKFLNNKQFE